LKGGRGQVAVLISCLLPWPPLRLWQAILSIAEILDMQQFRQLDAIAMPLAVPNIDTNKILEGRFLKTITRKGAR
jgi:hypothetical protein